MSVTSSPGCGGSARGESCERESPVGPRPRHGLHRLDDSQSQVAVVVHRSRSRSHGSGELRPPRPVPLELLPLCRRRKKRESTHLARPLASTWLPQIAPAYDVICHSAFSSTLDVKVPGHFTSHLTSPPSPLPPARRRPRSSEHPILSTQHSHPAHPTRPTRPRSPGVSSHR